MELVGNDKASIQTKIKSKQADSRVQITDEQRSLLCGMTHNAYGFFKFGIKPGAEGRAGVSISDESGH